MTIKTKQDELEEELQEVDEGVSSVNPLVCGLVTLHGIIAQYHKTSLSDKEKKFDIKVKVEICRLIKWIQDMRLEYLCLNFLKWYD